MAATNVAQVKRWGASGLPMGGQPLGGGVAHFLCTALGAFVHWWWKSKGDLEHIAFEAAELTSQKCRDHCKLDCSQVSWQPQLQLSVSIGLTLFSISGWFILALLWWCRGHKAVAAPSGLVSEDSTPTGLEEKRQLAHLQLAEVRSRRWRHGLGQ